MTAAQWTGVTFIEAHADDDGQFSAVQAIWEVADEGIAARLREQLCALLGEPEREVLMDDAAALAMSEAVRRIGVVVLGEDQS